MTKRTTGQLISRAYVLHGAAITQAREFLKKAELAHLALTSEKEGFSHSKSFAAAKRSSMDLTRALAKMRGAAA